MLSDISSITTYLSYTYAANANTQLGGIANLLESCLGAVFGICDESSTPNYTSIRAKCRPCGGGGAKTRETATR